MTNRDLHDTSRADALEEQDERNLCYRDDDPDPEGDADRNVGGERPVCPSCGSSNISFDAAVRWDQGDGGFDVTHVFEESGTCDDCEASQFSAEWVRS